MSDIEFVDGLIVKAPHENAPDFVVARLAIHVADLVAWLNTHDGEWVNAEIMISKAGKWYAAVDNWQPEKPTIPEPEPAKPSRRTRNNAAF
jgi:hypothetical protein